MSNKVLLVNILRLPRRKPRFKKTTQIKLKTPRNNKIKVCKKEAIIRGHRIIVEINK